MTDLGLFASCLRLPRRRAASSPGFALGRCHGSATGAAPPSEEGQPEGRFLQSPILRPSTFVTRRCYLRNGPKTYLYDSVIQLQAWLQYYCTNAARLLQFCCTAFAVLLHKPRSTAAKAVQQNCKGCAANVQRRGRKTAKARQPACGPIGPDRASPKCSRR